MRKINLPDVDLTSQDVYESEGQLAGLTIYDISDTESIKEVENEDIITESVTIERDKFQREIPQVKGESFQDRYERLLFETQQLQEELNTTQEPVELKSQVYDLLENLKSMKKATRSKLGIPKDTGALAQLTNQITSFRSFPPTTKPPSESDKLVYHLSYQPGFAKPVSDVDLETRITNLERFVGLDTLSIDPVTNPEHSKSLLVTASTILGALERLDRQLSLLTEPRVFEQTMRRVQESIAQLDRLVELKKKLKIELGLQRNDTVPVGEMASQDEKINSLYNLLQKLDPVANMIPNILARLKALKDVHNEAVQFSETLKVVKEDQDDLKHLTSLTKQGMENLLQTVIENQSKIAKNIEALDRRMAEFASNK